MGVEPALHARGPGGIGDCTEKPVISAYRSPSPTKASVRSDVRRLMHRLGRRPPAEAEAEYYARLHAGKHTGHT